MVDSKKITHVIFDMDGTIFDSETVFQHVFSDLAGNYGKEVPEDVLLKVKGRNERESMQIMVDDLKLPVDVEDFSKEFRNRSAKKLDAGTLLPGASKLISHFHNHGIPLALATSSPMRSVNIEFSRHPDLKRCFKTIISGSDHPKVKNGKPAPDIYLVTAKLFYPNAVSPENCLVFEDAPNGVRAALDAGMQVIMVNQPEITAPFRGEATQILRSLEHFRPEEFGLPPFCKCNNIC